MSEWNEGFWRKLVDLNFEVFKKAWMGLLPTFEMTTVEDSFKIPSRKEVAKELLRNQAARNAIQSKCLVYIWISGERLGVREECTSMIWPEVTDPHHKAKKKTCPF